MMAETIETEYWAVSIDDFTDEIFGWLERHQEGKAGHYARFTGTRAECVEKLLAALRPFVEQQIYCSDDYGHRKELRALKP